MNPPLRSSEDLEALLVALADGTVDAIATDHAPHARFEKDVEFERAAFGITGLETALALAITKLHREKIFRSRGSLTSLQQGLLAFLIFAGGGRPRLGATLMSRSLIQRSAGPSSLQNRDRSRTTLLSTAGN